MKNSVSIIEALNIIATNTKLIATEIIPIEESLNRVLAQDIFAKYAIPNFDNSAMDGYATSIIDAGQKVKVTNRILAGDESEDQLEPKTTIKVMTGAKVPQNTSLVVPFEDVEAIEENQNLDKNSEIYLPNNLQMGKNIRRKGEDITETELILEKGEKLNNYKIGILASQGKTHIEVFKKIKATVISTGSELKPHYEKLENSQIYNSNTPMLFYKLKELNINAEFLSIAKDNEQEIQEQITSSGLNTDLIITSGGISVGEADFTKKVFENLEVKTLFSKIEIKPGKPTTFGYISLFNDTKRIYVLNLPGNPSAAMINFEIFGKAILLKLSGNKNYFLGSIRTQIDQNFKTKGGRTTVILGNWNGKSFRPAMKQAPGMISSLSKSNGFIVLDQSVKSLRTGDEVLFIPKSFEFTSEFFDNFLTM
jgi:molybdopterin molybdotransferase